MTLQDEVESNVLQEDMESSTAPYRDLGVGLDEATLASTHEPRFLFRVCFAT